VVVPRRLRCEGRCFSVGTDRDSVVAEERVAQAHEGMNDIVVGAVAEHAPKVQRGLPGVVFEVKLGEVTVREERGGRYPRQRPARAVSAGPPLAWTMLRALPRRAPKALRPCLPVDSFVFV